MVLDVVVAGVAGNAGIFWGPSLVTLRRSLAQTLPALPAIQ
jgi:hypothetical protein